MDKATEPKLEGIQVFDGCLTTTTLGVTNFTGTTSSQVKVVSAEKATKTGASRRLIAAKDFNVGDEIFSVDAILIVSSDGSGCVACNCRRCMGWCDPFRFYFQEIRPALAAVPQIASESDTSQPLIRLVLKYIALKQKTTSPKLKEVLDAVFQLTNVRDAAQQKDDGVLADKIIAALPASHKTTLKKNELATLIGVLRTNTLPAAQLRGVALWPVATMVDHSCRENAAFENIGTKLVVTAISAIPNGQPITFNYTKPFQPKSQRLAYLKSTYHFECKCDRCLPEARDDTRAFLCQKCKTNGEEVGGMVCPKGDGSKAALWTCSKCQESPSDATFEKMLATENSFANIDPLTIKVNDLFLEKVFHPFHYIICRCLDLRVNLLLKIRPQSCESYLNHLLAATAANGVIHHPDRAVYYDLLAQARKLLGDVKGCKEAFTEATNIREKSSSKNSPLLILARQKSANPEKVEITLWHHTVSGP